MAWRPETHLQLEELESFAGQRTLPISLLTNSLIKLAKMILASDDAKRELGLKLSIVNAADNLLLNNDKSVDHLTQKIKLTFGWALHDALEQQRKAQSFLRTVIMSFPIETPASFEGVDSEEMESVFDTLDAMGKDYPSKFKEIFVANLLQQK